MYDIIGDIHGHYQTLLLLLQKMGYKPQGSSYRHPEGRKLIFVGDYVDRGPEIVATLKLVRTLVEEEQAIALMGNHEYNAILFNTLDKKNGGYLRTHKIKNIVQHYETLEQFKGQDELYKSYLDWMMTLPVFYENEYFRVVHACWDARCIDYLQEELGENLLQQDFLHKAIIRGSQAYSDINDTLKGKELRLPNEGFFLDKDGFKRTDIRVRWWENPQNLTWQQYAVEPLDSLPKNLVEAHPYYYPKNDKPVFFGHYWLRGTPQLLTPNACCLDYSVAKGDKLVAYRWDGEKTLNSKKLIWVEAVKY